MKSKNYRFNNDVNIRKAEMLLECIKLCRHSLNTNMLRVFAHEFLHLLLGYDRFHVGMTNIHV